MTGILLMLEQTTKATLPIIANGALKGFIILLCASLVSRCLSHASAALRHSIWLTALFSAGLIPLYSYILPKLEIPILPQQMEASPPLSQAPPHPLELSQADDVPPAPFHSILDPSPGLQISTTKVQVVSLTWREWLVIIWFTGVLLSCLRPLIGITALIWLHVRCHSLTDRHIRNTVPKVSQHLKLKTKIALVQRPQHHRKSVPVVWGLFCPALIWPYDYSNWNKEQIRSVLLHELAHIKRRDWFWQMIATAICALHWFNPLAWLALQRIRIESEKACDDLVLQTGVKSTDYAQHLLDIARELTQSQPHAWAALAMAHTSQVEYRLIDILNPHKNRNKITFKLYVLGLTITTLTILPLAALHATTKTSPELIPASPPAVSPPAVFESKTNPNNMIPLQGGNQGSTSTSEQFPREHLKGQVVDELGNPLAHVRIQYDLEDKTGTRSLENNFSDNNGRFTFSNNSRGLHQFTCSSIQFSCRNYVTYKLKDINRIQKEERMNLRIVMDQGHMVSGIIHHANGSPAASVLVEVIPEWITLSNGTRTQPGGQRAAYSDSHGHFVINTIESGNYHIQAIDAVSSQRIATAPLEIQEDQNDFSLEMIPIVLPQQTHPVEILGMTVINMNDIINDQFGLSQRSYGVLILDPGREVKRLNFGELKAGNWFGTVNGKPINSVQHLVSTLIDGIESREPGTDIKISYQFRQEILGVVMIQSLTQSLQLNQSDIQSLKALYAELSQTPLLDIYPRYHEERNMAGIMLMSVKAARWSYIRAHNNQCPQTLNDLKPYLQEEQDLWQNTEGETLPNELEGIDFYDWIKANSILSLPASTDYDESVIGYCYTMLNRHGKTCVIYHNRDLDYDIVAQADLEQQLKTSRLSTNHLNTPTTNLIK